MPSVAPVTSNVRPHTDTPDPVQHATSKASSRPGTKSAALATSSQRMEVSLSLYISQPGHVVQSGQNSNKLCLSKSRIVTERYESYQNVQLPTLSQYSERQS